MVYRLTLPTYIDPQALAFLQGAAPIAMSASRIVGAQWARRRRWPGRGRSPPCAGAP